MNLDKPKPKSTFETHIPKSIGAIVNFFESLEPRAFENLSNGLCVPNDPTLPMFCDVPLTASNDWRGGMFKMARHTTEQERCIFVLWKLTIFLKGVVEGFSCKVREKWAKVLVGSLESTYKGPKQRVFATTWPRFRFITP